jgi:hypothetical protein
MLVLIAALASTNDSLRLRDPLLSFAPHMALLHILQDLESDSAEKNDFLQMAVYCTSIFHIGTGVAESPGMLVLIAALASTNDSLRHRIWHCCISCKTWNPIRLKKTISCRWLYGELA